MERINYFPLRFLLDVADHGHLSHFNRALLENLSMVADKLLCDSLPIESYEISVDIKHDK